MSPKTDSSEAKSPPDTEINASLAVTFANIALPKPKPTKGKAKGGGSGRFSAVASVLSLVAECGLLSGATEGALAAAIGCSATIEATYADADAMNQFSQ
ncbi:hypothetical protein ACJ41O_004057 [Fusarium nematophilum]